MPELIRDRCWAWAARNLILPGADLLQRNDMTTRLRFLQSAQWWSRDRIHEYRDRALRRLMEIAWTEVPFYRSLFDGAGIHWRDIESPDRLSLLPVVDKDMLRANYPTRTVRNTGRKTYEASSSGSTGKNFFVREDFFTAGRYRACFLLALEWAGWEIGQPHMQTGMTLTRHAGRRIKDQLLRCHYVSAYDLSDRHLDEALDVLSARKIKHLWGYPGSLYYLARRALARGWNRPFRTIVTWGDNLFPHYRGTIERAFGTRVFDTYGCGEGFQVAAQCGVDNTYHLHDLDTIIEFLDDQGNPAPEGTIANMVVTRLHPGPMPLIRYRVGDLGVSGGARRCGCGRGLGVLESIQGRDTDVVITPSGNHLIVHFFTGLIEQFHEVDCFQVTQEDIGSLCLRLVPSSAGAIDRAVEQRITESLRAHGATDMRIVIEQVDRIPVAPSGKRRFVISTVGKRVDTSREVMAG